MKNTLNGFNNKLGMQKKIYIIELENITKNTNET